MPPSSVIVPVYNEPDGLSEFLPALRRTLDAAAPGSEILVVNDGSEAFPAAVRGLPGVSVLDHGVRMGYGAALKTGLRAARFEAVAIADGDGTYAAEDVARVLGTLDGCEMAVGARPEAGAVGSPLRKPAKWILTRLARSLARGAPIPDLNSGLRAFRRSAALAHLGVLPAGFSFTTTLTLAFLSDQLRIRWVPVGYRRRIGRSKFRPLRDTLRMAALIVRTVLLFNPLRILVPLGALFAALGAASAIVPRFFENPWGQMWEIPTLVFLILAGQTWVLALIADLLRHRRAYIPPPPPPGA